MPVVDKVNVVTAVDIFTELQQIVTVKDGKCFVSLC